MGFHSIKHAAAIAGVVLASFLAPALVTAQVVVRGVLYDDATGSPVRGTVMLVDPATNAPVVHATTDSLGNFDLKTTTGVYQIAAVRSGYTSILSAPIHFDNGERLTVRVPIAISGDPQHQIGVIEHIRPDPSAVKAAEMQQRAAVVPGFASRKALGLGLHYDRSDLDKANVSSLGQFLQRVPGLSVLNPGFTSTMQMTRSSPDMNFGFAGSAATACRIGWFVDGHRMDTHGSTDPITDGLGSMSLDTVEAIEVFRGLSEMPVEFAAPDLRCGAIAIWTRRG